MAMERLLIRAVDADLDVGMLSREFAQEQVDRPTAGDKPASGETLHVLRGREDRVEWITHRRPDSLPRVGMIYELGRTASLKRVRPDGHVWALKPLREWAGIRRRRACP